MTTAAPARLVASAQGAATTGPGPTAEYDIHARTTGRRCWQRTRRQGNRQCAWNLPFGHGSSKAGVLDPATVADAP